MKSKFVLILILILALSSACAPQATSEPTEAPAEPTEAPEGEEKIVLNFLSTGDPAIIPVYPELFDAFRKSEGGKWAHVEVEVQAVPYPELFTKIQTSLATDAPLDIVFADAPFVPNFAYNESLMELTDYVTDEELKQWDPSTIDSVSYEGKLYALPLQQSCSMMFYNKDLTDAAGIQPPETLAESWTMEESYEAWKKTTTEDVAGLRWGQGTWYNDYDQNPFRRSAGKKDSPTFQGVGPDGLTFVGYLDTEESVEAFTFYQQLFNEGIARAEPIPDEWFIGKTAFNVAPDNNIGTIPVSAPDPENFNYGITGIPYFADGAQLCQTGSFNWAISPKTENFEAALALIKFAAGAEGAKIVFNTVQQLPANLVVLNQLPEYGEYPRKLFAEGLVEIGVPRIQTPCYPEYNERYGEMLQEIVSGADVKTALETAAKDIESLCEKYK
jgi:fructooligosaccharide transport system substrate-binding protein